MSNSNILCFPKLAEDRSGLSANARVGEWSGEFGSLATLASALSTGKSALDKEGILLDEVRSVPSLWGRVASFENALLDQRHIAHQDAVGSWRALLALMALRKDPLFEKFNLEVSEIDLLNTSSGSFTDLAARQRPRNSLDGQGGWDTIRLVKLHDGREDHLIGILSPNSLMAPARSAQLGHLSAPWLKDGFKDPIKDPKWLSGDQKAVVALLVKEVDQGLRQRLSGTGGNAGRLFELLEAFAADLKASGSIHAISMPIGVDDTTVVQSSTSLLSLFNRHYSLEEPKEMVTDCLIKPQTNKTLKIGGDANKPVQYVLADDDLATSLKRDASEVSVYNSVRLSGLEGVIGLRDRIEKDGRAVMVMTKDDLFSDHLTPLMDCKIGHHGSELENFLLPFKPAVFLLFDESELLARVKVSKVSGGFYAVSLTFDIEDRHGNGLQHVMTRKYRLSSDPITHDSESRVISCGTDIENAPIGPDALAAWPNFKTDSWPHNYLYAVSNPLASPTVSTGVSSDLLVDDLERLGSIAEIYARLDVWCKPKSPWESGDELLREFQIADPERGDKASSSREHIVIQRAKRPFQGACFSVNLSTALFKSGNDIYGGIGLLPPARQVDRMIGKGRVSIDFGTTNTTIYTRNNESEAVSFKPRLRTFLAGRDVGESGSGLRDVDTEVDLYRKFMPPVEVEQPFATIAEVRNPNLDPSARAVLDALTQEPLIKDFAYFDTEVRNIIKAILGNLHGQGQLKFDLKWSKVHTDVEMVERYIAHLAMLSLAELASKGIALEDVIWAFSYPMSRTSGGDNYRSIVTRVLRDLTKSYGAENQVDPKVYFVTESDAALKDFQYRFPDYQNSRVMLDIGGGTTDIGIIIDRQPVWRNSFRLAGGDLMINFVGYNREFFRELGLSELFDNLPTKMDEFDRSERTFHKTDAENPIRQVASAVINSRQFAEAFIKQYPARSHTPSFEKLRAGAFLMMGGLLYYTGMQINALARDEQIDKDLNPLTDLEVCMAGRGSSLFKVLSEFSESSSQRLLSMVVLGAGRKLKESGIPGLRFSPQIKHEAAHGMSVMTEDELKEANDSRARFDMDMVMDDADKTRSAKNWKVFGAGVDYRDKDEGGAYDKFGFVPDMIGDLSVGASIVDVDIATFDDFMKALSKLTGLHIDYSSKANNIAAYARGQLNNAVKNSLDSGNRLSTDDNRDDLHSVNPPFIAMLKECLRMLYQGDDLKFTWKDG